MNNKKMLVIMAFLIVLLLSGNTKGENVLHAFQNQIMNCNEKTVLQCNISSSKQLNILDIYWTKHEEKGFKCDPRLSNNTPGFECNYTREALTLTILHPTPVNMGTYFCCIRMDSGHGKNQTNMSLGECRGEFSEQMAGPKQKECSFNSVYPDGIINWFHYDKNLTSNSTVTSLKNSDGTFNISSILNIQDNKERYNCSLWSLENGQYFKYQEFEVEVEVDAGSSPISSTGNTSTQHCLSCTHLLLALMFSLRKYLSL